MSWALWISDDNNIVYNVEEKMSWLCMRCKYRDDCDKEEFEYPAEIDVLENKILLAKRSIRVDDVTIREWQHKVIMLKEKYKKVREAHIKRCIEGGGLIE